ncbi:hypothetical protein [Salinibius halmophilus]|uniref:hypothetical protein n=1 Tax=Salinibius halmophilus TaxID=1853216 RepID=UPI000E675CB0|nr:hypothetical protein [Salinibius halmophilus]
MDERELFARRLGISLPWHVEEVEMVDGVYIVFVIYVGTLVYCPTCDKKADIHKVEKCSWRHINESEEPTIIHCDVPIARCKKHGMMQIEVPWALFHKGFTEIK